jgi:1-acyl-sn-glycerol-3-phosphate acyltransferase
VSPEGERSVAGRSHAGSLVPPGAVDEPPARRAAPPPPEPPQPEPARDWRVRWGRRAVTLPLFAVLAIGSLASLPVLLPLAAAGDLARPRRWALVRCTLFFVLYLLCEVLGVIAAFVVWAASGVWAGGSRERFRRWNLALQHAWGPALYRGASCIFAMRTEVTGGEHVREGPVILFVRHASTADTVLPVTFFSAPAGIALRYVLKAELLWDPCLDVVGHRLPNYFVRRGSGEGEREVAAIQGLMADLGPRDGVLIYPEGTRFSAGKRTRLLAKLAAEGDHHALEIARSLRHVLPPRLGGALGLLECNRGADAVFCAHTGLEGAASFWGLLGGGLVGATVRIHFWRVPFAEIPTTRAARVAWLEAQWRRVDAWIDAARRP